MGALLSVYILGTIIVLSLSDVKLAVMFRINQKLHVKNIATVSTENMVVSHFIGNINW